METQCAVCENKKVSRCSRCKAEYYCSKEHQQEDLPRHKELCAGVSFAQKVMEREAARLGSKFFLDNVGDFWGLIETREYMKARHGVIVKYHEIGTRTALELSKDHAIDCLRLSRSDNLGLRYLLPAFLLELNQDQEAYDCIKYFRNLDDDWSNPSYPFMNVKNADITEDLPAEHMSVDENLGLIAALTLIKVRAMLAAKNETIRKKLAKQVEVLMEQGHVRSKGRVWCAILNPGPLLTQPPAQFIPAGTAEETQSVLRCYLAAWVGCPQAIKFLESKLGPSPSYDYVCNFKLGR